MAVRGRPQAACLQGAKRNFAPQEELCAIRPGAAWFAFFLFSLLSSKILGVSHGWRQESGLNEVLFSSDMTGLVEVFSLDPLLFSRGRSH